MQSSLESSRLVVRVSRWYVVDERARECPAGNYHRMDESFSDLADHFIVEKKDGSFSAVAGNLNDQWCFLANDFEPIAIPWFSLFSA